MPSRCGCSLPLRRRSFVHALATGSAVNTSQMRRESGTVYPHPLAHGPSGWGLDPPPPPIPPGLSPDFPADESLVRGEFRSGAVKDRRIQEASAPAAIPRKAVHASHPAGAVPRIDFEDLTNRGPGKPRSRRGCPRRPIAPELRQVQPERFGDRGRVEAHDLPLPQRNRDRPRRRPEVDGARRDLKDVSDLLGGCQRRQHSHVARHSTDWSGKVRCVGVAAAHAGQLHHLYLGTTLFPHNPFTFKALTKFRL